MNPLSLSALRFAPFAAIILLIVHKSFTAEFPTFTVHRIDICSKPWSGTDEHFFLRNMLVESKRGGR
jgi:hypothetical protein